MIDPLKEVDEFRRKGATPLEELVFILAEDYRIEAWRNAYPETDFDRWKRLLSLTTALKSKDLATRWDAVFSLYSMGPDAKEAVPELIKALKDPANNVRIRTIKTLGEIGPDAKSAVLALKEGLQDSDSLVRSATIKALGKIRPKANTIFYELKQALEDEHDEVREAALKAILEMGIEASDLIPYLQKSLKNEDSFIRYQAMQVLEKITPKSTKVEDLSFFFDSLEDENESNLVRVEALKALSKISDLPWIEWISLLIRLIQDKNPTIRNEAEELFNKIGKKSIPTLLQIIEENDEEQYFALCALGHRNISPETFLSYVFEMLGSLRVSTRCCAISALKETTRSIGFLDEDTKNICAHLFKLFEREDDSEICDKAVKLLIMLDLKGKIEENKSRFTPKVLETIEELELPSVWWEEDSRPWGSF